MHDDSVFEPGNGCDGTKKMLHNSYGARTRRINCTYSIGNIGSFWRSDDVPKSGRYWDNGAYTGRLHHGAQRCYWISDAG